MLLHSDPLFSIYCGDKKESFPRQHFYGMQESSELLNAQQFKTAYKLLDLEHLVVLKQVHGVEGHSIKTNSELELFKPYHAEGDYLVTNLTHVGLGMASADCLLIIAYDAVHNAIGIAHAGWAGSLNGIATKMLEHLEKDFGSQHEHLRFFMGPSAKACCYEIKNDIAQKVLEFSYGEETLQERNNKIYFDLPLFNRLQLEHHGISRSAFHMHYNICTICNPAFCSRRRDGDLAERQMTIVALK